MSSPAELFKLATPLFAACESGDHASVKDQVTKLSKECLNYQHPRKRNKTALMLACEGNHEECVETLLSVPELNVNAGYYDLHSALTLAAEKGFIGIVKKLLATGRVDVNATCQDNPTALWVASANGHADVVKALLSYPSIKANLQRCTEGETALMAACAGGYCGIVQLLVTHPGIQFDVKDWEGNTAAMIALTKNDQNITNAVIMASGGTSLTHKNATGQTVLHIACQKGFYSLVALWIANYFHDVNVNAQDDLGMTPLMYALERGKNELHKLFLDHPKLDVRKSTKDGRTALDFTHDLFIRAHLEYLAARPAYSWLAKRLLKANFAASTVLAMERCLVLQEGFATEELFASIPRASFNAGYLMNIGVPGLGLQTFLLNLHKELHVPWDPPSPPLHSAALGALQAPCKRKHVDSESIDEAVETSDASVMSAPAKKAATKGDNKRKTKHESAIEKKD